MGNPIIDAALKTIVGKINTPLSGLYDRYLDERKYEDPADYHKVLRQIAENGLKAVNAAEWDIVSTSLRPFGFVLKHTPSGLNVKISINSRSIVAKY